MAIATGTRLGPYEVTAALGAGGMGEVYRARDTELKRDAALKVLPASLAALNHSNIAQIYGVEKSADGTLALAMELVEGATRASPPRCCARR